jgi:hypothetical protein
LSLDYLIPHRFGQRNRTPKRNDSMMMTPYVAGGICDGLHQLRTCGNPQNSDIFKKKWRPLRGYVSNYLRRTGA